jgi:hypothetical protein
MAKDARLELGRYISNPFNKQGKIVKQLDFNDSVSGQARLW